MRRRLLACSLLGLLAGIHAVPAQASSVYSRVLKVYEHHGQIAPCLFTSQELESARKGIDTYGAQYFQDFGSAIQNALSARASGACLSPGSPGASALRPGPVPAQRLRPLTAPSTAGVPAPLLLLALLAIALTAAALLAATLWWLGLTPPGSTWWRALWAEVGFRYRGTWLEFGDWLRSGRG